MPQSPVVVPLQRMLGLPKGIPRHLNRGLEGLRSPLPLRPPSVKGVLNHNGTRLGLGGGGARPFRGELSG